MVMEHGGPAVVPVKIRGRTHVVSSVGKHVHRPHRQECLGRQRRRISSGTLPQNEAARPSNRGGEQLAPAEP